jgi:hypothetical protein
VLPPLSVAFLMPISQTGHLSTATTRTPLHLYFISVVSELKGRWAELIAARIPAPSLFLTVVVRFRHNAEGMHLST